MQSLCTPSVSTLTNMDMKFKCNYCKESKPEKDYYVCKSRGIPYRKRTCKVCFNRAKHRNARRRAFIELTEKTKFEKHERFKDNTKSFSHDAKGALREGDIYI